MNNYLINGYFDVWQRATSVALGTSDAFAADRWRVFGGTGVTGSFSRQAFDSADPSVPTAPDYFGRLAVTVAGSGSPYISQRIEPGLLGNGHQLVMAGWLRDTTVTRDAKRRVDVRVMRQANALVEHAVTTLEVGPAWEYHAFGFTLPLLAAGETAVYIEPRFQLTAGETAQLDLAGWGFVREPGDIPARPALADEYMRCYRYYERFSADASSDRNMANGLVDPSSQTLHVLSWIPKRAQPAVTLSAASAFRVRTTGGTKTLVSIGASLISTSYGQVFTTMSSAGSAGNAGLLRLVSGSGYLEIDAEL